MSAFDVEQRYRPGLRASAMTPGPAPRRCAPAGWIGRRLGILLSIAASLILVSSGIGLAADDREACAVSTDTSEQKIASCTRVITDAAASAQDRARAYDSRGRAFYKLEDYDRAIDDFGAAIDLDSDDIEAHNNRALAYSKKNEIDRAIADYGEGIKINPNYPTAYNNRGFLFLQKKDYDHALADFSEAIRRNGIYALAYENRGRTYAAKSDFDRALADYKQAIKLNPKLAGPRARLGALYASRGDYDSAIVELDEAIARDKSGVYAYRMRCNAYYVKRNYDAAIADCNEAIRLRPDDANAYAARSFAHAGKREFDAAIADGGEAIRLNPQSGAGYNSRGIVYWLKKDYDAAIVEFNEAIRLDPNLVAAYGNRGNVYRDKGDADHAIADFGRAIAINPQYFRAYNDRGKAYAARGENISAIADYDNALKINPRHVQAYDNRGLSYLALGRTADAMADFQAAQSIDPADAISRAQLALIPPGAAPMPRAASPSPSPSPSPSSGIGLGTEALGAVMNGLSINLPMSVAGLDPVRASLEQLFREPCDQEAIAVLGPALERIGRKREAATAALNFSGACGGHAPSLKTAANILLALSDYSGAAAAASELIKLNPQDDGSYYLRALANDRGGFPKKAIDDYAKSVELFGNKSNISSDSYLAIARNYEKLGQFCDAELAVESWVALNPERNDSSRMQAIVADYTAKGKCDAPNARSEEVIRIPPRKNVVKLSVSINGVRGTFIMDTGASLVTLGAEFAQKAKVEIDQNSKVRMNTANGVVDGKKGQAATVQLRSLQAKDVAIAVQSGKTTYGDGVDGLLGMSFLSRFKVSIDTEAIRISSRGAR
jgi:clan AA aspartic protease (TIGR02281 family)